MRINAQMRGWDRKFLMGNACIWVVIDQWPQKTSVRVNFCFSPSPSRVHGTWLLPYRRAIMTCAKWFTVPNRHVKNYCYRTMQYDYYADDWHNKNIDIKKILKKGLTSTTWSAAATSPKLQSKSFDRISPEKQVRWTTPAVAPVRYTLPNCASPSVQISAPPSLPLLCFWPWNCVRLALLCSTWTNSRALYSVWETMCNSKSFGEKQ